MSDYKRFLLHKKRFNKIDEWMEKGGSSISNVDIIKENLKTSPWVPWRLTWLGLGLGCWFNKKKRRISKDLDQCQVS